MFLSRSRVPTGRALYSRTNPVPKPRGPRPRLRQSMVGCDFQDVIEGTAIGGKNNITNKQIEGRPALFPVARFAFYAPANYRPRIRRILAKRIGPRGSHRGPRQNPPLRASGLTIPSGFSGPAGLEFKQRKTGLLESFPLLSQNAAPGPLGTPGSGPLPDCQKKGPIRGTKIQKMPSPVLLTYSWKRGTVFEKTKVPRRPREKRLSDCDCPVPPSPFNLQSFWFFLDVNRLPFFLGSGQPRCLARRLPFALHRRALPSSGWLG